MTVFNSAAKVLPNLRVLEIASFIPGHYCGKLLASLGAEVVKAEPLLAVSAQMIQSRLRELSP